MIPYRVYYSQKRIRSCVVKKVDLPIEKNYNKNHLIKGEQNHSFFNS